MLNCGNGFCEEEVLPFSAKELFSVVIDVEKYPEFLPWCKSVHVRNRSSDSMVAELTAAFMLIEGKYTSDITFSSPEDKIQGWIRIASSDGVFKSLWSEWRFLPRGDKEVLVKFSIGFDFKSKVFQLAFDMAANMAKGCIINAFRNRADRLFRYGK